LPISAQRFLFHAPLLTLCESVNRGDIVMHETHLRACSHTVRCDGHLSLLISVSLISMHSLPCDTRGLRGAALALACAHANETHLRRSQEAECPCAPTPSLQLLRCTHCIPAATSTVFAWISACLPSMRMHACFSHLELAKHSHKAPLLRPALRTARLLRFPVGWAAL
jgi:hypothetical protein